MLAIGLALVAAFGFGSATIFARLGMQGIRPLPSTMILHAVIVKPIASITPVTLLMAHLFLEKLETATGPLFLGALLAIVGVVLVVFGSGSVNRRGFHQALGFAS